MEKTIDDFIIELQRISEDKRKLPLVISCSNGELAYPSIKMLWNDQSEIFSGKLPDKMIITF